MPFDVQVTLLRVLQTREVVRIGGKKSIRIDVRIIAATNRDLEESIANNAFREDLYYRLNVFAITVQPLRERQGDVRILSEHMLRKYAGVFHKPLTGFAPEARDAMERYAWPGNLRELENAVERAVLLAQGDAVTLADLPGCMTAPRSQERTRQTATHIKVLPVAESEERLIREAMAAFNGNIRQSSRHLGLSRSTLYRKMKKYGIDGEAERP